MPDRPPIAPITAHDPVALFQAWYEAAIASEPNDPNAMSLATATPDGVPSVRIVLMKDFDARGFVFYTNLTSQKGRETIANPHVALAFHWKSLRRQVRITGAAEPVTPEEADAYFAQRPYGSRIGAWASLQSSALEERAMLEARVAAFEAQFPESQGVPRPAHWSGFRVVPARFEFWQDMPFRLHDRLVFTPGAGGAWDQERLYP